MLCRYGTALLFFGLMHFLSKAAVIAKKSGKPVPVDPMAKRNAKVNELLAVYVLVGFLTPLRPNE